MNIKKFHQLNEKELSLFDDELDMPFGKKIEDFEEEEEEEDEVEEYDEEAMNDLLDLLRQLIERNGINDFYIFNDGMHIHIQIIYEDITSLDYISKAVDVISKIEKETLTQYESEIEMWRSDKGEPVMEVSFFYEPNKKIKPFTFGSQFGEHDPFY